MIAAFRTPARRVARRLLPLALAGALVGAAGGAHWLSAVTLAQAPCVQAPGTTDQFTDAVFSGDAFVGEATGVPRGDAYVAVVAGVPSLVSDTREVRALLQGDHENLLQEWFVGSISGNVLDLASENGARLTGELTDAALTGAIAWDDGPSLTFELAPATGVAGFFTVTIHPDGQVEGASERGVALAAAIETAVTDDGVQTMAGALTPPTGEPLAFAIPLAAGTVTEPVQARFIVLPDGRQLGGAKQFPGDAWSLPYAYD